VQLTLYMLRRGLPDDEHGLRKNTEKFKVIPNRGISQLHDVTLRVHQSDPEPPFWLRDLLAIADFGDLNSLLNRHTGALLTVLTCRI
jgi:hypothetical protein